MGRIFAANISIFDTSNNLAEKINNLHSVILDKRCTGNSRYESSYKYPMKNFNLSIYNNNYFENWDLEEEKSMQVGHSLNLDISRKNPAMNICLKSDRDFILTLIEKKFIDCVFYYFGLLREKRRIFSSKYHKAELIGYEYAVFIEVFYQKYMRNWDLIDKYSDQIRSIIKSHWKDLKQENNIITVKRSEFDTFFKNVDTPFSKEIMEVISLRGRYP